MPIQQKNLAPILTVDVVVFTIEDGILKVLLTRRFKEPFKGAYALPGAFIDPAEKLDEAAKRILKERAGVTGVEIFLEQLYTFDGSGKDPRGSIPTVAYFALVRRDQIIFHPELHRDAMLIPVKNLPPMAFAHADIVRYASNRLRFKLEYTNAVAALLPTAFTFAELQKAYETIFDRTIDKRNFRKKFLALNLIKETTKMRAGGRHRPARLYVFKSLKPQMLPNFF
jgi:8-oxo-dGTP diphosphatase